MARYRHADLSFTAKCAIDSRDTVYAERRDSDRFVAPGGVTLVHHGDDGYLVLTREDAVALCEWLNDALGGVR